MYRARVPAHDPRAYLRTNVCALMGQAAPSINTVQARTKIGRGTVQRIRDRDTGTRLDSLIAIAAALLAIAAPAAAQLHKCTTQDGRTIYSDRPCSASAASAPITARPIAAPTQRDAAAAAARRASAAEAAREIDRRQAVAAAQTRALALDDAAARVDEIKRRNFDPRRCVQARQSIANRRAADPIGWRLDSSVFELEAAARLYCGP